jgi:peptidoglycan/LPS O-acetylase OafA/YrhL
MLRGSFTRSWSLGGRSTMRCCSISFSQSVLAWECHCCGFFPSHLGRWLLRRYLFLVRPRPSSPIVHPIVLEFLYGVVLASAIQAGKRLPPILCWLFAAAGFVLLCSVPWGAESLLRPFIWGLPAAAIVAGALGLEPGLGVRTSRWLLELGDASYSILSHPWILSSRHRHVAGACSSPQLDRCASGYRARYLG